MKPTSFILKKTWGRFQFNYVGRVWRYQRRNQNPQAEEGQTTQWTNEKGQKDKQWSTKTSKLMIEHHDSHYC